MLDRALLARYFRQRAELGERELFLEGLDAAEVLRLLTASPLTAEGGTAGPRDGGRGVLNSSAAFARIREVLQEPAAGSGGSAHAAAPGLTASPDIAAQPAPPSRPRAVPPSAEAADPGRGTTELTVLAREAAACTKCRLHAERRSVVFGEGNPSARLVVVGEAPGQEEDRTGRPFVGQAGKLLNLLLMTAGFARDEVYICNTLKCRPPQNRNPLPDELTACSTFLKGQLGAIAPSVLLAVGKFAAQSLVGSEESISRLRGRIFRYEGIPLIVSYHPAFLLRSPQWTRTAWEDFQLARKVLDEQA